MKLIKWMLCSAAILLFVSQPSWAITATNSGIRNMPLTTTSGTIDRGGTITAVNPEKETITVDGVTYSLAASIKIYAANGLATSRHNLRESVPIHFSTVKDTVSGREKIIEIWIANSGSRPPHK